METLIILFVLCLFVLNRFRPCVSIVKQKFRFYFKKGSWKISYERRDNESVDEKKPILGYVPKNYEKKNSKSKGLKKIEIYKFVYPFSS